MMREKASPAKKTHPSTPYPLRRRCPHRYQTPCFQLAPSPHIFCFQVRSKLRSVRLLHLHLRPNFCTRLRIQLIRMKLDWNNRTVVLEHLHHLVWIQSHTLNWLQHARAPDRWEWGHQWDESSVAIFLSRPWWGCCGGSFFVMFLFFLARAQQVSCGKITVLTSTKKKVRRVLARKSLPRTNQNSPSAFSHQIRNNSKKDKTKMSQMMGWIENRPNKFLNQNFVR